MPLSKARNRERMKRKRATCVQPKDDALQSISSGIKGERDSTVSPVFVQPSDGDIIKAIETLDNAPMPTDNRKLWYEGEWYGDVQPIPNCPNGRYRRDR